MSEPLPARPWDWPTVPAPSNIKGCPVVACAVLAGYRIPQSWAVVCQERDRDKGMTLYTVQWRGAYVVIGEPATRLAYEDAIEDMMLLARRALARLDP